MQFLLLEIFMQITFLESSKRLENLRDFSINVQESIVGSLVECSPATRAARVRFPDDAIFKFRNETLLGQSQSTLAR